MSGVLVLEMLKKLDDIRVVDVLDVALASDNSLSTSLADLVPSASLQKRSSSLKKAVFSI